ncbi:MAG TPA: efflux RND transporter periplasmic adaptor subunit [Aquabacterium sp.]|uniref:efflux RND transporter periplasmic adaptor subunit n=1 Tax=Aquabacterium sp. TaxID=1872578 RepID=UPI002E300B0B|nr:efflux RND transporter periplasmic adaptor subunit [Aquabacterium sp.]HEX5372894.1 efflux RND transporter periplasmic adaptor subunit [Aquabacterium sp.]
MLNAFTGMHLVRPVTALMLAGSLALSATAAAIVVPTIVVQPGVSAGTHQIEGTVEPIRQATVAAQTPGTLLSFTVKAGDSVRAGQVLAQVDARQAQASLAQSDASMAQAQALAHNARLQLDRTRELSAKGFVSSAALDSAQAQWRAAQAGLQAAQAGQQQAALQRGFTQVTAPFDGIVLATHVNVGDLAAPGRALLTVYAPGALRVVVQVPASQADAARTARRISVRTTHGTDSITPIKSTLLPVTDMVAQTVEWRLDLPPQVQAAWRPGQSVQVQFDGDTTASSPPGGHSLRLPASAILRRGELTGVYVVRQGQFTLQAVRTRSAAQNAEVEVLTGLKAGDTVALDAVRAGLAGAQAKGR